MNSVLLLGRLTADPDLRKAGNSKDATSVVNFSLAVPRIGSEEADFIRCVAFGKTAEWMDNYLKKGSRIAVTGRIQTGRYDDKDGKTVYTTDVICERIDFADDRKPEEEEDRGRSTRSNRRK